MAALGNQMASSSGNQMTAITGKKMAANFGESNVSDCQRFSLDLLAGSTRPMKTLRAISTADLVQNLNHFRSFLDEDLDLPSFHLQASTEGSRILIRNFDQSMNGSEKSVDFVRRFLDVAPVESNPIKIEMYDPERATTNTTEPDTRCINTPNGKTMSDVDQSVPPTSSEKEPSSCLKVKHLCQIFPFHVILNCRSEIIQIGPALVPFFANPESSDIGRFSFTDCFDILHPVRAMSDLFDLLDPAVPLTVIVQPKRTSGFARLKGELHSLPELSILLFLPFPLRNEDSTTDEDISQNLVPRDLVRLARDLDEISRAARRKRRSRRRLENVVADLRGRMSKVEADKGQTDSLLSSIFPPCVVEKLRSRRPVDPVTFELVTILFADIVQFTALCGDPHVTPMDVVRMLNHLYTQFDLLSNLNDVYKVETIGDAYMVVGGFPVFTPRHADVVISMAFEMIRASQSVCSPVNHQPIQVRIGVHSGPCVAGVVGHLMPRYCLFGRTVALANQMETLGGPDMINISEDTLRCISFPDVYQFEENHNLPPDLPCRSFFISQTPASPVLHTLDLPVPLGLFRTPATTPQCSPSKHASRQTTPHSSPEEQAENEATPLGTPTRHGFNHVSYCTQASTQTTPNGSPFRHAPIQTTPNSSPFRYASTEFLSNGSPCRHAPTQTTPNASPCRHNSGKVSSSATPSLSAANVNKATPIAEEYTTPQQVHIWTSEKSLELGNERYNVPINCSTSRYPVVCQSYFNPAPEIHLNDLPVYSNIIHNGSALLTTEQSNGIIGQSPHSNCINDQSPQSIGINDQSPQSNGINDQSPQSTGINDQSPLVLSPTPVRSQACRCSTTDSEESTVAVAEPWSVPCGKAIHKSYNAASNAAPPSECIQTKAICSYVRQDAIHPCGRNASNGIQLLTKEELQRIKRNARLVFYFRPQARSMSPSSERSCSDDDKMRSESVWCFRDINEFVVSEADEQR